MNRKLLDVLVCPGCLPDEYPLALTRAEIAGEEVFEGVLGCGHCGTSYPIRAGVAVIVPAALQASAGSSGRYEQPEFFSAYMWSHYADLSNDPEATPAYTQWGERLARVDGAGLDAGCATGRFTFEMAQRCEFAVGIDMSENFISAARKILRARGLVFKVREEGRIYSERSFKLPDHWQTRNVEFLVADAQALPFRSDSFSCVASLNVLDRVPRPLEHLFEINRTARSRASQLLVSDPFSWTEEVSPPENWLGGKNEGKFSGLALDNIVRILSRSGFGISPTWKIAEQGAVWWKIRNHTNHYELIRSLYLKAER